MSDSTQHSIKAYLTTNNFSTSSAQYVARVYAEKSLTIDDIAESAATRGGSTLTAAVIAQAVRDFHTEQIYQVFNGNDFTSDYYDLHLSLTGTFDNEESELDDSVHKLHVTFVPKSAITDELDASTVTLMGKADTEPHISQVTDILTGSVDSTITASHTVNVTGRRLKIVGDDESVGIKFVSTTDGTEYPVTEISCNQPKQLTFLAPDMPTDTYQLVVTTQYSTYSYTRKDPRSVTFSTNLSVE